MSLLWMLEGFHKQCIVHLNVELSLEGQPGKIDTGSFVTIVLIDCLLDVPSKYQKAGKNRTESIYQNQSYK